MQFKERNTRIRAARILWRMGDRSGIPVITALAKDSDPEIRKKAVWTLAFFNEPSVASSLLEALEDSSPDVRAEAAVGLLQMGFDNAEGVLLQTIREQDSFSTSQALIKTGGPKVIYAMTEMLKSHDEKVRERASYILSQVSDKSVLPILLGILNDPDPNVRDIAVNGLKNMGDSSTCDAILNMLKDPDENVRQTAIEACPKTCGKTAVGVLLPMLKDPNEYVRQQTILALGKIGDQTVIPYLKDFLKDKDKYVRLNAALALMMLGDRSGFEIFLAGIDDSLTGQAIEKELAEMKEISPLYRKYLKTKNIFLFNILRTNLLFSDELKTLADSKDPFGYYLLALKAREEGNGRDQLDFSSKSLDNVDEKQETALAILSYWLKAQGQLKMKRWADALSSVERAEGLLGLLSRKERDDYGELFEQYTLFLKGEIYSASGRTKAAIVAYENTLKELEKSKKEYNMKDPSLKLEAMVRTSLGTLQIKQGKENLEKAVEGGRNYQANDSVEMENEEKRYMELSRQKIAEGSYEEAQKLIEELNLRRTQYVNRRMKLNLADPEKQRTVDEYRKKQEEIEAITRKIDEAARRVSEEKKQDLGDEALKGLAEEKNRKRRELQVYLTNLKKTHPDMAALMGAKPIELNAIQEQMPEDVAIIQYLMLPDKVVAFVIRREGVDIVETQMKKEELKESVVSLRSAIFAKVGGKDSKAIQPLSAEINEKLIRPVEAKLKGVHVLGIAPSGFLHQLPFGVLADDRGTALIERYNLFYISSTSILGVAMDRGKQKSGEQGLLAFSNPDGSLPSSDEEVRDIEKYFAKKEVYSRNEAKKEIIKSSTGYSVLHLSTHGVINPTDSTKSYLLMADGKLSIEEIWGLPLAGVRLTALSACETGIGEVLSGDDVVSLESAFIYAGSPSVIATLWKVADKSTAELMEMFYENLMKGKTKAEALTEAQRELKKKYPHPFFWAAFTLRGDWR